MSVHWAPALGLQRRQAPAPAPAPAPAVVMTLLSQCMIQVNGLPVLSHMLKADRDIQIVSLRFQSGCILSFLLINWHR